MTEPQVFFLVTWKNPDRPPYDDSAMAWRACCNAFADAGYYISCPDQDRPGHLEGHRFSTADTPESRALLAECQAKGGCLVVS